MVDYRAWLKNVMSMAAMVASAPIPCLKGFWEYRWMGSYLGTFMFIDRLFEGYRGPELVIAHIDVYKRQSPRWQTPCRGGRCCR